MASILAQLTASRLIRNLIDDGRSFIPVTQFFGQNVSRVNEKKPPFFKIISNCKNGLNLNEIISKYQL